MQFVKLVNTGSAPYDFHMRQQKRVIPPGGDVMVPWDVATSLFGDPFTTDTNTDQARQRAWTQSATLHNYHVGGMTEDEWQAIRPSVEVYDVETGNRVYMVLEDPSGTQIAGEPPTSGEVDNNMLVGLIRSQQEQINTLMQAVQNGGMVQVQGQSPLVSQDAGSEEDPNDGLSFGGPILPVIYTEGAMDQNVPTTPVTNGPKVVIPNVDPSTFKPSVGGAAPAGSDPDALAELTPIDPSLSTTQVREDEPQTVPTKLAPRT